MPPSLTSGYAIIAVSLTFLILGTYAVLLSPFLNNTNIQILDTLANDTHYKYISVLIIPIAVYIVIANWVGWQYFQNS